MANQPAATTSAEPETDPWLTGIIPPVCTPLTADLDVDVESFERLIGFLIDGGVSGLFVLGSSSEAPFLRDDQRDTVVEVAVKTAAGQVPVLAGAIDMTTGRMIEHARRAASRGADGIVATAPFYARVSQAETDRHFREIKKATGLPLLAYDIPVAVHTKLEAGLVLGLARDGVLAGLKDSSGDLGAMRSVIVGSADLPDFAIFTGSEIVVDCVMEMGGDGAVPGLGNVDPHGFSELYRTCRAGDWKTARRQQERLLEVFQVVFCGDLKTKGHSSSALGGFKSALMLRGVIATNAMALPQFSLDDEEVGRVRDVLVATGLL